MAIIFGGKSAQSVQSASEETLASKTQESLIDLLAQLPEADRILLGAENLEEVGKWGKRKTARMTGRANAFLKAGVRVFPQHIIGSKLVFVDTIDRKFLKAAAAEGMDIFFARSAEDKVVGTEKEKDGYILESWNGEKEGHVFAMHGECEASWVLSLGALMVQHYANITTRMTVQQLKEFLTSYLGSEPEDGNKVAIIPLDGDEKIYSKILLDLDTGVFTTNRDFAPIRYRSYIHPAGEVMGKANYALLALMIAGNAGRSIQDINGILAFLTQVWEEEDVYGMVMSVRQRLRHVRHHSAAVMRMTTTTQLPFFYLENDNSQQGVERAAKYYSEKGVPYFLDKYGVKRIVVGPGIHALYLGVKRDAEGKAVALNFITETAKEKKLPNRPWNATAIVAEEGIPGTSGYRKYTPSAMCVRAEDEWGEEVLLEELGDKRFTVFTNKLFASNGSGVGEVGETPFSYSIGKSMSGAFNSINLKQGQSLESAAEEIEAKIRQLIGANKTLKASDINGFRNVLSYNGVDILTFSGFNQDILIGEGSKYEVKRTPSSESLLVSLSAKLFGSYHEVKFRGLAIKAVLKRSGMELLNHQGKHVNYEVHMGLECQKGQAWLLPMFCEAICTEREHFCILDVSKGVIEIPHLNHEVDLSASHSMLTEWVKKNRREFTCVDRMCRDEFEYIYEGGNYSDIITYSTDPNDSDIVIVKEKVVGIAGQFTGNVEVSTRPENSSVNRSYMTIEQLAGVAINNAGLAAYLA